MLLNDPLGVLRRDVAVPRPLRIHDADGTGRTDPQAVALRAEDRPFRAGKVQLLQPLLEVVPRVLADVGADAVRPDADEQVSRQLADAELRRHHVRRQMLRIGHGAIVGAAPDPATCAPTSPAAPPGSTRRTGGTDL